MSEKLGQIEEVRNHFKTRIEEVEKALSNNKEKMENAYNGFSTKVKEFFASDNVSHKLGEVLSKTKLKVDQLRLLRIAIYKNSEVLNNVRVFMLPELSQMVSDSKSLYSTTFTYITGDNKVIQLLSSTSEKEREATYMLLTASQSHGGIKALWTNFKTYITFLEENLDALNKMESSLRLENNLKLTDAWTDGGSELTGADLGYGHDPLFDDMMSGEGEKVSGEI